MSDRAAFKWEEEKHPRGQPENKGQFGPGGSSSTSKSTKSPARAGTGGGGGRDPATAALTRGKGTKKTTKAKGDEEELEGYSENATIKGGVIHTSDVDDAAKALHEGRRVELDQARGVSVLLDKLGSIAERMIERGEKAPSINLCNLTIKGSNLFCAQSKGIPRIEMPQMNELQTEGFKKYLVDKGYKVKDEEVTASHMRATQNELNGVKVAGIAKSLREGEYNPGGRTVISDDDYILDGHHRWAARIGNDSQDGSLTNDTKMPVSRVDISITQLLEEALVFTEGKGRKSADESTANAAALYTPPKKTADEIVAEFEGAKEKVAEIKARLKQVVSTDALVSEGGHKQENGKYTPERQAIHEEIVREMINPKTVANYLPEKGQSPVVTVLGGRGGSGKSWLTSKDGPIDASKTLVIDSDEVKSKLPEYEGWNAAQVHEESSDIVALIDEAAATLGINVTLDGTLKSTNIMQRIAVYQGIEEHDYELEGYYMYASPETAATRALGRWAKGGTFSGRFVPPEVILGNTMNEANFDTLSSNFRKWAVYDNDGEKGAPKLIEKNR